MFELPLFPLNTVLFPGTPIHLHIFEERYKRMIGLCLQESRPFGVVLIRSGLEATGPLAETYPIGCTAQIAQVERLEGGRLNIVAIGQERVRIFSFDASTQPYLLGQAQVYPLENPDPAGLELPASRLRRQFERFVKLLLQSGSDQVDLSQLPQDVTSLAYLAAAVLQLAPLQKQELLAMDRADRLIDSLQRIYQRELSLMRAVLSDADSLQAGGFSRN
jgi:Lon protease-like protein